MGWKRGQAYSQDLRDRVFALADEGYLVGEVAETLRVSIAYVSKVLSRRRMTGALTAGVQCNHVPLKLASLMDEMKARIEAEPDTTLAEMQGWLSADYNTKASSGVISRTLARIGLTRKKRPCTRRNRNVPTLRRPAPNGARHNRA